VNWSPHLDVDPQPYIEAGYYTEHNKFIVGGIHAGYKNEAILGYAYDFNKQWRVQVDFQSGAGKLVDHRIHMEYHSGFSNEPCNLLRELPSGTDHGLRGFHLHLSSLEQTEGRIKKWEVDQP
jgi:hypothetical protein